MPNHGWCLRTDADHAIYRCPPGITDECHPRCRGECGSSSQIHGRTPGTFLGCSDPAQRALFALAAYNGGFHHIRDAMALTRKHGGNPQNWGHVREYVLRLTQPAYYGDPVVKYGYMRGTETADYVDRIRARWSEYCGGASFHESYRGGSVVRTSEEVPTPSMEHR